MKIFNSSITIHLGYTNTSTFPCSGCIVWFDVQRDGKIGYHEAQVVEMDLNSAVKRVKFHFWRLPNGSDEWVEVGSPRIAPHVSFIAICVSTLFDDST